MRFGDDEIEDELQRVWLQLNVKVLYVTTAQALIKL